MNTDISLGTTRRGNSFTWFSKDRSTHMQVVGASGRGKSKFLENLLRQDIGNEERPGVLLIDPHGNLYNDIVAWCSSMGFKNRTIHLVDPSVEKWVCGYNPLQPDPLTDPSVRVDAMVQACAQVWGRGGSFQDTAPKEMPPGCVLCVAY